MDPVQQLAEITGLEQAQCSALLESFDWNMEAAVDAALSGAAMPPPQQVERPPVRSLFGAPAPTPTPVAAESMGARRTSLSSMPGARPSDIPTELRAIYREHCPEKLCKIPELLNKFSGREAELLRKVKAKYMPQAGMGPSAARALPGCC